MFRNILFTFFFTAALSATGFTHGTGSDHVHPPNEQGIETARLWLSLVDRQKYNAARQTAAGVFKSDLSHGQWENTMAATRVPLGRVIRRTLYHDRLTAEFPGMPDGRYLVLRFVTRFENKRTAVETVVVAKEADDAWRVAGYRIK